MKAKPILEKYQYEKAVDLYLQRIKKKVSGSYDIYPLDKQGIYKATVGSVSDGDYSEFYYEGTFKNCIIQFMQDGHYFGSYVEQILDSIDNCNNGYLSLYKPEKISPKKVKEWIK